MAIDLVALRSELDTDPGNLGYAPLIADGQTGAIAALMAAKNYERVFPMPIGEFRVWAAKNGALVALHDISDDKQVAAGLRSACYALLSMLSAPDVTELDPSDPDTVLLVTVLDSGGVLVKSDLVDAATRPCGRGAFLFGVEVTHQDVARAMRS